MIFGIASLVFLILCSWAWYFARRNHYTIGAVMFDPHNKLRHQRYTCSVYALVVGMMVCLYLFGTLSHTNIGLMAVGYVLDVFGAVVVLDTWSKSVAKSLSLGMSMTSGKRNEKDVKRSELKHRPKHYTFK